MHDSALITTVVVGLTLAFAFGLAAQRLKLPPIVGYLLAGVAVGPFTPGFVADQALAVQLADIGVILLMFGVGLQFSFEELVSLRAVAVPGALLEMAIIGSLGTGLGLALGWPLGGAVAFGLSFSVASTVVLLRALQERRLMDTDRGRIAVGWLIVEDLMMALALVLMPALASASAGEGSGLWLSLALTLGKVLAFGALMLIVGRRLIPLLLHYVAHTGSRELFRLAVLAIALGVAFGAAWLFGVSFALGAFFAGMVLSESQLSQQAAQESLPLRDAFAVLFFVSVGMLFNPMVIMNEPLIVAAAIVLVLVVKSGAAFAILRFLRQPVDTALTMGASLAQIGEFSFILIGLALTLGIVEKNARDIVVATSIICILLNPLLFAAAERLAGFLAKRAPQPEPGTMQKPKIAEPLVATTLTGHTVVVGYGRVGGNIGESLKGRPFLVIEDRDEPAGRARRHGAEVILGNAADPDVLRAANLAGARNLLITIPQAFEAGQILEQARAQNPLLRILARAHSDAEVEYLMNLGATRTVMGEAEIARVMTSDLAQGE
jgi:CPA2 family monovalent cation:H+ antiporter-2